MSDEETIITVDDLKKRLRLAGIDYSNYTDEDLEDLINLIIERIEAVTNVPISGPRLITEYVDSFNQDFYETDFYPLSCYKLTLNDEVVTPHHADTGRGIFYFKHREVGDLEVKYEIQYTNRTVLAPLIADMVMLDIEGDSVHGTWNSIREGEVSVTYGVGSGGLQGKVDNALAELKGYYKPRARLL